MGHQGVINKKKYPTVGSSIGSNPSNLASKKPIELCYMAYYMGHLNITASLKNLMLIQKPWALKENYTFL